MATPTQVRSKTLQRLASARKVVAPGTEVHSVLDLYKELGGEEVVDAALQQCREEFGDEGVDREEIRNFLWNNVEPFCDIVKPNITAGGATPEDAARQQIAGEADAKLADLADQLIDHWIEKEILLDQGDELYEFSTD